MFFGRKLCACDSLMQVEVIYVHVHTCTMCIVYTYVHTYVRTYVRTYIHAFIYIYIYIYVCVFVCLFVCICLCVLAYNTRIQYVSKTREPQSRTRMKARLCAQPNLYKPQTLNPPC